MTKTHASHDATASTTPDQGVVPVQPPDCGTPGTPPCPPGNIFVNTRAQLIDQLCGKKTTKKKRQAVTRQVDTYLQAILDSTVVLINGALAIKPPK
jgi:hypothetical protein